MHTNLLFMNEKKPFYYAYLISNNTESDLHNKNILNKYSYDALELIYNNHHQFDK